MFSARSKQSIELFGIAPAVVTVLAVLFGVIQSARADAARAYLVENYQIDSARLVARGFGSADPLREVEVNAQDKLYNRRVDLRPLRSVP